MIRAPLPENESARIDELYNYQILDTPPEIEFDDFSRLAAYICGTPVALITLIDKNRQWFKSKVGTDITETPRDIAFCTYTVLQSDVLVVSDMATDRRFATNPLVTTAPHLRFYAGSPLITPQGHALGSLCVLDFVPRELSLGQVDALRTLGRHVVKQLELRQNLASLKRITIMRQQAEEALRQSKEWFRHLVEHIDDWVWAVDRNLAFIYVSPRITEILGYEPDELIGRTFDSFMCSYEAENYAAATGCLSAQQGLFAQLETQLIHKDGHPIDCEISGFPVFNQKGNLQSYQGIMRDVTERKRGEQEIHKALVKEKELNDLKSCFINMVSHEFRTPLTTILASAESLEHYNQKWSDEKKITYLQHIQIAVRQLDELLKDVLLIGCADAGRLEFKPALLNLKPFCHKLVNDFQLITGNKHQLNFVADCLQDEVCVDEKLLRCILVNLLSNSIKYSPKGGDVDFHLFCQDDIVKFQVQDSGIGIPFQDLEQLFQSFYRATNVGNIPGTGLGLSIVKHSVDVHGGSITVTSEVGVGTTFTVIIPIRLRTHEKDSCN